MPTSVFFNGRVTSTPGSYTKIDASGLDQVGLGATGIVAILGTSEGGMPASEMTTPEEFLTASNPQQGQDLFRSGDLREAIPLAFAPSKDPAIPGGAVQVIAMKVNPATQAEATFANTSGSCLTLTARDYGAFTSQYNTSIANGTTQGKLLTLNFEDTTETKDDLGGSHIFTLKYVDPGNGWDTMTGQVLDTGIIKSVGTRASLGMADQINHETLATGKAKIVSTSGSDLNIPVTVYGLSVAGAAQSEVITSNGTTPVEGTLTYAIGGIRAISVDGTIVGSMRVNTGSEDYTIQATAGTDTYGGLLFGQCMYMAGGKISVAADSATTKKVLIWGHTATGAEQSEVITLTGATPVSSANDYADISVIVLSDVEHARTVTLTGTACQTDPSVQSTIQKCADFYNARYIAAVGGFTFTLVTTVTGFDPDDLDVMSSAVSILTTAVGFHADLWSIIDWVNNNSQLFSAEKVTGAKDGAPSNTTSPVFATGGSEGTTLSTHWQGALNLLKQTTVSTIVPLTGDPAVHAMVEAHCAYMCGQGRNERDAVCGAMNSGLTDVPTKTEYKSQIVALNSRHVRLVGQAVTRYNIAGTKTEFTTPFLAVIIAGMQAGATEVGTPLTHKYINALSVRSDSSWNSVDDVEEMITAAACFCENVAGVGIRVVRNITTYLVDDNLAYSEASTNQAVNYSTQNFREEMENYVGQKGFSGTAAAAKSGAIAILSELMANNIIVDWRSLSVSISGDTMTVSVEIAPVIGINFVLSTVHLVIKQFTA